MKSESVLKITGKLRIVETKLDRALNDAELRWAVAHDLAFPVLVTSNLVLNVGLDALVALIGGAEDLPVVGGTEYNASTIRELAVRSMEITDQVSPLDPTPTDSVLEGTTRWTCHAQAGQGDDELEMFYASTGQIKFSGYIPPGNLDGYVFTEEGLFTNDGKLVARTTFRYHKTTALGLQFDHTWSITRA